MALIALKSVIQLIEWLLQVDFTSVKKIYESYRILDLGCCGRSPGLNSFRLEVVSVLGSGTCCHNAETLSLFGEVGETWSFLDWTVLDGPLGDCLGRTVLEMTVLLWLL